MAGGINLLRTIELPDFVGKGGANGVDGREEYLHVKRRTGVLNILWITLGPENREVI